MVGSLWYARGNKIELLNKEEFRNAGHLCKKILIKIYYKDKFFLSRIVFRSWDSLDSLHGVARLCTIPELPKSVN